MLNAIMFIAAVFVFLSIAMWILPQTAHTGTSDLYVSVDTATVV